MKKTFLISLLVLLVFSFAAQAEVVEKTRWNATLPPEGGFYVPVNASGIAAGYFNEATQRVYGSASNNDDTVRDYVMFTLDSGILELSAPAKLKATYIYNVPRGGIAGQVDAAMSILQVEITDRPGAPPAAVEITEPSGGFSDTKIIKLTESPLDQTYSVVSRNVMPAGKYYAVFEFRVPGYMGRGEIPTADALNAAKVLSIKLETQTTTIPLRPDIRLKTMSPTSTTLLPAKRR
jgi:hypothetical protein